MREERLRKRWKFDYYTIPQKELVWIDDVYDSWDSKMWIKNSMSNTTII